MGARTWAARLVGAALLVAAGGAAGAYLVHWRQDRALPNRWAGTWKSGQGDGAYWIVWTQNGADITGSLEEGTSCGGAGVRTSSYPLTGTIGGNSITVRIDYNGNGENETTEVGTVTRSRLAIPSVPVMRPGTRTVLPSASTCPSTTIPKPSIAGL